MIIQRKVISDVEKVLRRREIVALVGLRQVGKSTIMEYFYNKVKGKKVFLTLDDFDILRLFEDNLDLFIEKYVSGKDYLFIDEVQYAKDSGKRLKLIYDKYKIKIFISGSSKSELAIHSLKYLVGRVFIFDCYPLSLKDIIGFEEENSFIFSKIRNSGDFGIIKDKLESFLIYGGYPEVYLEKNSEIKREILKNIKNTYLLKEISEILNYKNLREFEDILRKLAIQDGQILNKNSYAKQLGIHNNRVGEIIDTLNKTGVLYFVEPYLRNKSKEIIKSKKTYFADLGFKNILINNFNKLKFRYDKGEIYENFILSYMVNLGYKVNYWNYRNLYEVDFVIERDGEVIPIEVKSDVLKKATVSMKRFIDEFRPKKFYVFCENVDGEIRHGDTRIIFTNYLNVFKIFS